MYRHARGFTLIELMIVIAILGILLAIAVPMYSDYSARARVSECVLLQAPVKLKISEAVVSDGVMPPADEVTVNRTTDYCDGGQYLRAADDSATLIVNVNEAGAGIDTGLVVEARLDVRRCGNRDVEWACYYAASGGDTTQGRYLPASCRETTSVFPASCAL